LKAWVERVDGYERISEEMGGKGAWGRVFRMLDLDGSRMVGYHEFLPLCVDHGKLVTEGSTRELYNLHADGLTGKVHIDRL
jgi:hypothetical protein